MGFIDADAHVLENDATWDYCDPSERHYRPVTLTRRDPATDQAGPSWDLWVVGDTCTRRHPRDGRLMGVGRPFDVDATALDDVTKRLEDLDLFGIDVQVLISTFFISVEVDHPLAEAALTRSYNRWMAERTADAGDDCRGSWCPH
jgi:hypothetical protein